MLRLTGLLALLYVLYECYAVPEPEPYYNYCDASDFECPRFNGQCTFGLYADPCNCSRFVECYQCQVYKFECPEDTIYDPHRYECVAEDQYTCWASTEVISTTPHATVGTGSPPDSSDPVVFSVARTLDLSQAQEIVHYQYIFVDRNQAFNMLTGLFNAPRDGVYLFAMSAATKPQSILNINFRMSSSRFQDLYSNDTRHDGISTCFRSMVVQGTENENYFTHMSPFTSLSSNNQEYMTSYTGVQLDALFYPLYAFYAGMETHGNTTGTLMWTTVNTDLGGNYDAVTGNYIVPAAGIYYIELIGGQPPAQPTTLTLHSDRRGMLFRTYSTVDNNNGVQMLGNAGLFPLVGGEKIRAQLDSGGYYSDSEMQTAIVIYKYSPTWGDPVAWYVYTLVEWDLTVNFNDLSPFPYTNAYINSLDVYNFATGKVTIIATGYYYLHLNVGTWNGANTRMRIWSQEYDMLAGIERTVQNENGELTSGRGFIYLLNEGDMLWVELNGLSGSTSDQGLATSFSGYLLYPL